jgi:hypothetical protein
MTYRCWVAATVAGQHRLSVAVGYYALDLAAFAERHVLYRNDRHGGVMGA